jgi:aldose 1-epimerase
LAVEELRFRSEDVEVVVLPDLGGRLHRLRVIGHDLLRTPPDPRVHARDPFFWGAYVMAPWCNRIAAEPTRVGDRLVDLARNFPDGTAIHGQVYDRPWDVDPDGGLRVRAGGDGWPWRYAVTERLAVGDASLRVELSVVNESDGPMPAGLGLHPWFVGRPSISLPAATVHRSNLDSEPRPAQVEGRFDLRRMAPIPADLDGTWADLDRPAFELEWPGLGVRAAARITAPAVFVVAASPSALDATAIETQTHAPNGLRRLLNGEPGGLTWLDPGGSLDLALDLAFEALA